MWPFHRHNFSKLASTTKPDSCTLVKTFMCECGKTKTVTTAVHEWGMWIGTGQVIEKVRGGRLDLLGSERQFRECRGCGIREKRMS